MLRFVLRLTCRLSVLPLVILGLISPTAGLATPVESSLVFGSSGPPSVEVKFSLPEVVTEKDWGNFVKVAADGMTTSNISGLPAVPVTGVMVAVPKGYSPTVKILSAQESFKEDVVIAPYRVKHRCGPGVDEDSREITAFYSGTDVFPREVLTLEKVGLLQDVEIYRVGISPVQMDMGKRGVRLTTRLKAQIDFVQLAGVKSGPVILSPTSFRAINAATVNGVVLPRIVTSGVAEKILVVTADDLKASLNSYVAWKRQMGYAVQVVTRSQAGATPDAVKAFIQTLYNDPLTRPTFLLMVGNTTSLPPFYRPTSSGNAASDYPFSLLSGSDILSDLFYGRLVADNASEVTLQTKRWIEYERDSGSSNTWMPNATTIASSEQGQGPSDEDYSRQIQGFLKGNTYQNVDSFFQKSQTATAANIKGGLVSGRTWLTYIGHGSGTSWGSTNDTFNVSTIRNTSNAGKLPFIIDVACENGNYGSFNPCFGKQWVTHTINGVSAGAVAYYGASVSTSWDPPAVMAVGIAKRHFERGISNLGAALVAGQLYLSEQMGVGDDVVDNMEWYNLFGDPSLQMRTAVPQVPQIDVSPTAKASGGWRVKVKDGAGKAFPGALVAWREVGSGLVLGSGRTDAQGIVDFSAAVRGEKGTPVGGGQGRRLAAQRLEVSGYNLQSTDLEMSP